MRHITIIERASSDETQAHVTMEASPETLLWLALNLEREKFGLPGLLYGQFVPLREMIFTDGRVTG